MAPKKKPAEKIDPTLPFTEIEIRGTVYRMCFTYRAIGLAEARLRAQGHDVVLLYAMPQLTFLTIPVVLAAALGTFHPELTFGDVQSMVDYDNVWVIANKMSDAWRESMPKPIPDEKKENPSEPVLS